MGSYANIIRESSSSILGDNIELDLPVLEGYGCSDGYLLSMAECLYNENVDFANSMECEFREAAMEMRKAELEASGAVEEAASIEVLTESASDIIEKLKELLRKLGAKINSIYEAVKTRIMSFLTRDYNKFYNSNKDKFNKKYSNFKGNIKWMQPKTDFTGGLKMVLISSKVSKALTSTKNMTISQIEAEDEIVKDGSYLDSLLSAAIVPNTTDRKSFKKDFKESLFDDRDTVEGVSSDIASEVNKILGTKDIINTLNKSQKSNKELFKTAINSLNSIRSNLNSGKDGTHQVKNGSTLVYKGNNPIDSKRIALSRSRVLALQTACNMINGEYISLTKSHLAQCKAVFTKVCASIKEQTLLDTLEECVYDETIETLESIEA